MGRPTQGYRNAAGDRLPGVTTICGLLDKPALVGWAYKRGREHEALAAAGKPAPRNLYDEVEKAAEIGTLAHECCEAIIHGQPLPDVPADCREKVERAVQSFRDFMRQTAMRIIVTERPLVSERHQFGGTLDFICEIDGRLCLGDFKTSGAVYPEMLLQLAAYQILWAECVPDQPLCDDVYLFRMSKETADFAWHKYGDLSRERETFLLLRQVYANMQTIRKR